MINQIGNIIALYDLTRPFVWKFNSNTAVNLVYVIQVKNNNGIFEDVSGLLRQPMEFGSQGDFYINPSEILSDEIDMDIRSKNQGNILKHIDGYVQFRLSMIEETLTSNNTLTYDAIRNNWINTASAYGIDAATQHEETFSLNQANWLSMNYMVTPQNSPTKKAKWLTNKPLNSTDMSVDDNEYIYAFVNTKFIEARIYIESESQSLHFYDTKNLLYGLNSVGIGVPNIINSIGQSTWDTLSGTPYRIRYVLQSPYGEVSEKGSYIINKDKCTKERLRVYWKNRKGGIDGYTFNSELEVTTNVSSKLSKKALGYRRHNTELQTSANYINNNTYAQSSRTLETTNIKANEQIKVTSRFHTQEQLRWLSEIFTSPKLWIENLQTGELNAVYSITKKVRTKPKGKGIGQIKLTLMMSNEIMTQR
jgi:hypothetical protein